MAVITTAVVSTVGVGVSAYGAHQASEYQDAQMQLTQEQLQAQRERNARLKSHWQEQKAYIRTGIEERQEISDIQEDVVTEQFGSQKKLQDMQFTRQTEDTFSQVDNIKSKAGFATSGFIDEDQGLNIADMMEVQHQQSIDAQNELQQQILNIKSEEMSEIAELEERGDILEEIIAVLREV